MQIRSTPENQVIVAVGIDNSGSERGLVRSGIETVHAESYQPSRSQDQACDAAHRSFDGNALSGDGE
jgi:hypothetical protein